MTNPEVKLVTVSGSRRVAVHYLSEGGSGRTLVFCHAAPGAATLDPDPQQTQARGVRLLAADRPGYGLSDPVRTGAWASVSASADDLATVLTQMGIAGAGVVGWSAGGRVALALAARHPELVDRVAVVATPAPHEEVPWIPAEQMAGLDALRGLPPDEVHAALNQQLSQMIADNGGADAALKLLGSSPADEAALALPGVRERLDVMLKASLAQGAIGIAGDIAGYCLQPWGFELQAVQAKTLLLYGAKDPVAGARHGSWWQQHLPNARLEMSPDVGHLLIFPRWPRILSFLAPHAQRQG